MLAVVITVVIWMIIMGWSGTDIGWNTTTASKLWTALGVTVSIPLPLFTSWAWKLPIFQRWLVLVPYVQGTWKGVCQPNWVDPVTGKQTPPVEIYLVIRQTLLTLSCTAFTEESSSVSLTSSFCIDEAQGQRGLSYTYRNRPEPSIRGRSPLHEGTAVLSIIGTPVRQLNGEYWTNRQSIGGLSFEFLTERLAESFVEAKSFHCGPAVGHETVSAHSTSIGG